MTTLDYITENNKDLVKKALLDYIPKVNKECYDRIAHGKKVDCKNCPLNIDIWYLCECNMHTLSEELDRKEVE